MNLSQYRLDEKLLSVFDYLTDEQKIETAIQEYSIDDILLIFTYYELEQYPYAKKLLLKKYRNNPPDLYYCAKEIIGGRWLEAEPMLMTSTEYTYLYSRHVIKGRWPEAELMIMANLAYAYYYARYVIKGRWLEAEPTIMNDSYLWQFYKDCFKCCN